MLAELHVRDLGVIEDLTLTLGEGMTALTGETGAGKTLVVGAIELLVGERAEGMLVRPGADEARVEGRFVDGDVDVVLARAVPREGRSRAYVDGRLASAAELAEIGARLVDLHGQHSHQSLLSVRVQRAALDRFGAVDARPLAEARTRAATVDEAMAALGGDSAARAREIDMLDFQLTELESAAITGPDEDEELEAEEDVLAAAIEHREAGDAAHAALRDDAGAADAVAVAIEALAERRPFAHVEVRLRSVAAEIEEAAGEARRVAEGIIDDPERRDQVRARRRLLRELCRKYGERLSDVLAYAAEARGRMDELRSHEDRVRELETERLAAQEAVEEAAAAVGRARRAAAPRLASAVEEHLRKLALPRARFEVAIEDATDDPSGATVNFLLGANPGEPALPLAKAASGGELARAMLACRLVLSDAPPTLVFDEVDAGVGGQAALAVGQALATLATEPPAGQVLVVTHLAQVAAFGDHQVVVTKRERDGRTVADARHVTGPERVVELSRMLSGQPASTIAQEHAEELLATASRQRSR